jgi:hypothetical protein
MISDELWGMAGRGRERRKMTWELEGVERKREDELTISGANGLFLNAPPTARGDDFRASESAL